MIVRESGGRFNNPYLPLRVIRVADGAPAGGVLRRGDVILDVRNEPYKGIRGIFDRVSQLNAGHVARLLINRSGRKLVINVRLGSLMNAPRQLLPENDYSIEAL